MSKRSTTTDNEPEKKVGNVSLSPNSWGLEKNLLFTNNVNDDEASLHNRSFFWEMTQPNTGFGGF